MRAAFLASMLVMGSLAGCAATDAKPLASTAAPTAADADRGQGSIHGLVQDPELRPVPNARIQVISRQDRDIALEVESDAEGRFTLTGLAAGDYLLYVARLGFHEARPQTVTVPEGEAVDVKVILEPLPTLEPFHRTEKYTVYFHYHACVFAQGTPVCPLLVYTSTNTTRAYKNDEAALGELKTFIVELHWRPNVGQCGGAMRSDVYSPDETTFNAASRADSNPFHWDNVPERAKSPTRVFIPRDGEDPQAMLSTNRTGLNGGTPIETEGKWTVVAFPYSGGSTLGTPIDYQCTLDQRVNIDVTAFYNEPAPGPDWSALP